MASTTNERVEVVPAAAVADAVASEGEGSSSIEVDDFVDSDYDSRSS